MVTSPPSLLPADSGHVTATLSLSRAVAQAMDESRQNDQTLEQSVERVMNHYGVPLPSGMTAASVADRCLAIMRDDGVYDSELGRATRAMLSILGQSFGDTVTVTGWLPGEVVKVGHKASHFQLTGGPCPKCKVNPLALGWGGGVRCVTIVESPKSCGYWYCA